MLEIDARLENELENQHTLAIPNPYKRKHYNFKTKEWEPWNGKQDDSEIGIDDRTSLETGTFLKGQHDKGVDTWGHLCLGLQRSARGLDAKYDSALDCWNGQAHHQHKITTHNLVNVPYGAAIFYRDSGPYGHVVFFAGTHSKYGPVCWSSDALGYGKVWLVSVHWFEAHWDMRMLGYSRQLEDKDLLL